MASSTTRIARRRTTADWHALVQRQRDSDLSAAAFCREHDLVYQTFVARRRQLLGTQTPLTSGMTTAATPPSRPRFVEIGVTEPSAAREAPPSEWLVELDLGEGMQLRIRSSR